LALRGSNEIVGSRDNGNYLGILELIGQFDPFLSQHIVLIPIADVVTLHT